LDHLPTKTFLPIKECPIPLPFESPKTQEVAILSAHLDAYTDEELMDLYQNGQNEALGHLIKRLRPKMDQVARSKVLDRELANDALQEACITIFKTAKSFRGESKVFTWVYRLVVNACIDQLRKEKTRSSKNIEADSLEFIGDLESDFSDKKNTEIAIRAALASLSKDQRESVSLVWIEGYTVEEASDILGIPLGTVKSRCDRGKKALAEFLRELDPNLEPDGRSSRQKNGGAK
jgi:RNA polymerase sigma factor (sigma-70 family)